MGKQKIYLIKKKIFNLTPEPQPLANNAIWDNQSDKQQCGLHIYIILYYIYIMHIYFYIYNIFFSVKKS